MHDKCYDSCNNARNKCDGNFQECLKDTCRHNAILRKHNRTQLTKCEGIVDMMYSAAAGFGCVAYKDAQGNACLCG